jgi:hypothetical protein
MRNTSNWLTRNTQIIENNVNANGMKLERQAELAGRPVLRPSFGLFLGETPAKDIWYNLPSVPIVESGADKL